MWIKVKDRVPDKNQEVFYSDINRGKRFYCVALFDGNHFYQFDPIADVYCHQTEIFDNAIWMPIPEVQQE